VASDGLHALVPGNAPSPERLDEMTRVYQQSIRQSTLWDEMVREFGEKKPNDSLGSSVLSSGECRRAIPRADIWIYREAQRYISGKWLDI
jgi:hypothetical protein